MLQSLSKKLFNVIKCLIITKNNFTHSINTVNSLSDLLNYVTSFDTITLPDEANYSYQEVLNVLSHVATPSTNLLNLQSTI